MVSSIYLLMFLAGFMFVSACLCCFLAGVLIEKGDSFLLILTLLLLAFPGGFLSLSLAKKAGHETGTKAGLDAGRGTPINEASLNLNKVYAVLSDSMALPGDKGYLIRIELPDKNIQICLFKELPPTDRKSVV